MNGRPYRAVERLSYPSAMAAGTPPGEDVATLRVTMPNGFDVEFCPLYPLSIGNPLVVRAKRIFKGQPKNDYTFTLGKNDWAYGVAPLSDDDIRRCVTPDGPLP